MNKESLEKMSRMRLLGMHHAFKTNLETEHPQTFTNDGTCTSPRTKRMG